MSTSRHARYQITVTCGNRFESHGGTAAKECRTMQSEALHGMAFDKLGVSASQATRTDSLFWVMN
jgi:hypothetical protein